jgi:hypothetical protein
MARKSRKIFEMKKSADKRRAALGKERTRRHDDRWKGSLAMQVEDIKQTDLTQSERDVLKDDATRWRRMGGGGHLDDWLDYQRGLMIRRTLAMKLAHTNRPEGKAYTQAFAQLMKADGLDTMDKTSISAVLWLGDDPERMRVLRELREAMTPGQRSRLNSPISARQRVEQITKAREAGTEETVRSSPVALLKNRITEQARKIAELEQQLAKATDGSLFDLKRDSTDDIATAIVSNISESKAKGLAAALTARLKKQRKPAG